MHLRKIYVQFNSAVLRVLSRNCLGCSAGSAVFILQFEGQENVLRNICECGDH